MEKNKGIRTVAAGAFIMFMLGAAYVWGVYKQPLSDHFGWSKAAAAVPFSTFLLSYTVGMIIGGKLQDKYGPGDVCTVGGLLFGGGYFAAGFAGGLAQLAISYGIISGFGAGLAYVTPVAAAAKWFPSKKGLVSGIIIFGFGAGAFILSPAAGWLISERGWRSAFKILGGIFFMASAAASRFISAPDESIPSAATAASKIKAPLCECRPSELFGNSVFWAAWSVWFLCLSAGLGAMGHLVTYAVKSGVAPMKAAILLSVIAIFNGAGRIILGSLSDKIGRLRVLAMAAAAMAAVSFGFAALKPSGNIQMLYVLGAVFGTTFGALLVLYPAITADFFGTKHLGANYGILFSSYGLAGIAGPIIYGKISDAAGTYSASFIAGGAASCAAMAAAVWMGRKIGFSPD